MTPGTTINVLDHGFVRYVDHMGSDLRIVEAARISYKSPSKGDENDRKLLEYLWKNLHTSPFEQCKITFDIKMPVFAARQYVRHRTQSMNEVSARYTELPHEYYIPRSWRPQDTKNKQSSIITEDWNPDIPHPIPMLDMTGAAIAFPPETATDLLIRTCDAAYSTYQALLFAGVSREMARMVLPVNFYTQFYATWDLKNLLHFIRLRDDGHAQWEMQEYAKAIKSVLKELFPWTVAAFDKYKFTLTTVNNDAHTS